MHALGFPVLGAILAFQVILKRAQRLDLQLVLSEQSQSCSDYSFHLAQL